jgi:hypothetical protein
MHELVVPLPLSGPDIHSDQALAEQPITRTMPAVDIAGRQLDREVSQSEFLIDTDLSPHTGIAVSVCRTVFPGIVSELPLQRDGVKDPQALARFHIEAANVASNIL